MFLVQEPQDIELHPGFLQHSIRAMWAFPEFAAPHGQNPIATPVLLTSSININNMDRIFFN
jgi:hypothetical protein